MSETYGRRRGRLAAAKVEPVNGHYVAFLNKKIEQDVRDRIAAETQAPVKKKRGPRRKKEVT